MGIFCHMTSGKKRKLEDAATQTDLFYSQDNKNEGEGSPG